VFFFFFFFSSRRRHTRFSRDWSSDVCSSDLFGGMTVDSKPFARKDSLVYLLRQHSGFYNYYNREDLTRFCKELSSFNIPEDYQDLSSNLDTINAFYAKIRILVE